MPPLCSLAPPLLTLLSHPALVFGPLFPRLLIVCLLLPPTTVPCSWLFFCASCLHSPPESLRVLQWNAGGLRSRSTELLYFLSSHPVDLDCIRGSSLNSSSSPDSWILCSAFWSRPLPVWHALMMPRTLAAASSFSSGRAYPFLNFLPPLFLRLIPALIVWGSTSLWAAPPRSLFLMCTPPCSLLSGGWRCQFLFSLHSSLLRGSLCSGGLWLPSPSLGLGGCFRPPRGGGVRLSRLLWPPPPQWPRRAALLRRSSPDISFAPFSLALFCSWEVLQGLGSDRLPVLLSVLLSPVFRPGERPPSLNFRGARWDGFAFYIDSRCSLAEEYSSLSLSSAAALFTSLALGAAGSSIPFGRIGRPPGA